MKPRLLPKDKAEAERVIAMRKRIAKRKALQQKRDLEVRRQRALFNKVFNYKPPRQIEDDDD